MYMYLNICTGTTNWISCWQVHPPGKNEMATLLPAALRLLLYRGFVEETRSIAYSKPYLQTYRNPHSNPYLWYPA